MGMIAFVAGVLSAIGVVLLITMFVLFAASENELGNRVGLLNDITVVLQYLLTISIALTLYRILSGYNPLLDMDRNRGWRCIYANRLRVATAAHLQSGDIRTTGAVVIPDHGTRCGLLAHDHGSGGSIRPRSCQKQSANERPGNPVSGLPGMGFLDRAAIALTLQHRGRIDT